MSHARFQGLVKAVLGCESNLKLPRVLLQRALDKLEHNQASDDDCASLSYNHAPNAAAHASWQPRAAASELMLGRKSDLFEGFFATSFVLSREGMV